MTWAVMVFVCALQAGEPEVKEPSVFVKAKAIVGLAVSNCWTELDGFYTDGTQSKKPVVSDYLECVERKLKEVRRYVAKEKDSS